MANGGLDPIFGELILNTDKFTKPLKDSKKQVKQFPVEFRKAGKSADSFSKSVGVSFRALGKTLASPIPASKKLNRSLKILRVTMRNVSKESSRMRAGLNKVKNTFGGFKTGLGKVNGALLVAGGLFGGIFGFGKVAGFAGEVANVDKSFKRLLNSIGEDSVKSLKSFRKAASGTISDMQLMRQANTALVLGVGSGSKDFEKLIRAARQLGKATGRSAAEGLSDLTIGIGRQSKLILDNLGIIISIEKANKNYADSNGLVASKLDDAQKKLAFFEETMRAVDKTMLRLGTNTFNFADVFNKLKATLSNIGADLVRNITPGLSAFVDQLSIISSKVGGLGKILGDVINEILLDLAGFIKVNRQIFVDLLTGIATFGAFFTATLSKVFKGAGNQLTLAISDPLKFIKDKFVNTIGAIAEIIVSIFKLAFAKVASDFLSSFLLIQELSFGVLNAINPFSKIFEFKLPDGAESEIKSAITELNKIVDGSSNSLIAGPGKIFLKGILGFSDKDIEELNSSYDNILKNFDNFLRNVKKAQEADISAKDGLKSFIELKDVSKETSDSLIKDAVKLEKFRIAMLKVKAALDGGEFKLSTIDTERFKADSDIVTKALKDRADLAKKEIALGRERIKQASTLKDLLKEIAAQSKVQQNELDILNLSETEKTVSRIVAAFKVKLGKLTLADPEELLKAEKSLTELARLSKRLLDLDEKRKKAAQELAKAKADELAAFKASESLLEKIANLTLAEQLKIIDFENENAELNKLERAIDSLLSEIESLPESQFLNKANLREDLKVLRALRLEMFELSQASKVAKDSIKVFEILKDINLEAFEIDLDGFDKSLSALERRRASTRLEIDSFKITPEAKTSAKEELEVAFDRIKIGLEKSKFDADFDPIRRSIEDSFGSAGSALVNALKSGQDIASAIGDALSQSLTTSINQAIDGLGKGLAATFRNLFTSINEETGKLLAGVLNASIGIIGTIISRASDSGSSFSESRIDENITSSSVVRGIVAGPTTIPIAEVGVGIREAMRGTEGLLKSIDETLKDINGQQEQVGASSAGALTT